MESKCHTLEVAQLTVKVAETPCLPTAQESWCMYFFVPGSPHHNDPPMEVSHVRQTEFPEFWTVAATAKTLAFFAEVVVVTEPVEENVVVVVVGVAVVECMRSWTVPAAAVSVAAAAAAAAAVHAAGAACASVLVAHTRQQSACASPHSGTLRLAPSPQPPRNPNSLGQAGCKGAVPPPTTSNGFRHATWKPAPSFASGSLPNASGRRRLSSMGPTRKNRQPSWRLAACLQRGDGPDMGLRAERSHDS